MKTLRMVMGALLALFLVAHVFAAPEGPGPKSGEPTKKSEVVGPARTISVDRNATQREPSTPASVQEAAPVKDSYWIGVRVSPVPELLLSQFDFPEADQGLIVVEEVLADSPAAKAGLKRGDVLLSFSDKKLHQLMDLVGQIAKVKGTAQKIDIVRGGQKKELTVTPEKQPQQNEIMSDPSHLPQRHQAMRFSPEMMMREMENYFRQMQGGVDGQGVTVLKEDDRIGESESKRIEVESRTDQNGKTTLHVTRKTRNGDKVDEKTWQAESVDQLPEEIRGEVKALFGNPRADR